MNPFPRDQETEAPDWDLSREYSSFESPAWHLDVAEAKALLERCVPLKEELQALLGNDRPAALLPLMLSLHPLLERARLLHENLDSYVFAVQATASDSLLERCRHAQTVLDEMSAEILAIQIPFNEALSRLPPSTGAPQGTDETMLRSLAKNEEWFHTWSLSPDAEALLAGFAQTGPWAWFELFASLRRSLMCSLPCEPNPISVSQAQRLLGLQGEPERRETWQAIRKARLSQAPSFAAALSAISGWTIEETRRRARGRHLPFHEIPLRRHCRLSPALIETLLSTIEGFLPQARALVQKQAARQGKERLDPWDVATPAGNPEVLPFVDALELILNALGPALPRMVEFVAWACREGHVQARVSPCRHPGGVAIPFPKSGLARIYLPFRGTLRDTNLLAHELGHAFQERVISALPFSARKIPRPLAETAAIFPQMVFTRHAIAHARSEEERQTLMAIAAEDAINMILMCPSVHRFERGHHELRASRSLTEHDYGQLWTEAARHYFGDTRSETDDSAWCTHEPVYVPGRAFTSIAYTFSYLLSLGLLAQQERMGPRFEPAWMAFLGGSGTQAPEDLAQAHFGIPLHAPGFWEEALKECLKLAEGACG